MQSRPPTLVAFQPPAQCERRSRTFTVAQTAAFLGITKESTFRLIREGAIPARGRSGRIGVRPAAFAFQAEVLS